MKKFVLLSIGFEEPTKEVVEAWMKWFEKISPYIVDSGNPFAPGKEVTKDSVVDLSKDKNAITGYTIINAESYEKAIELVKDCPIITSMRIYETMSM